MPTLPRVPVLVSFVVSITLSKFIGDDVPSRGEFGPGLPYASSSVTRPVMKLKFGSSELNEQ
jgi:hypothetical protein